MIPAGVSLAAGRGAKVANQKLVELVLESSLLSAVFHPEGWTVSLPFLLLFRTGWIVMLREHPWPMRGNEPHEFGQPGIGLQACRWLKDKQVAAIAFDNLGVEAIPFDPEDLEKANDVGFKGFPVHIELLVWQGMPMGEIWDFEELAKDCAEDGVYEFMLTAPPLRVVGGIGNVLSPLAIK